MLIKYNQESLCSKCAPFGLTCIKTSTPLFDITIDNVLFECIPCCQDVLLVMIYQCHRPFSFQYMTGQI